MKANKKVVYMVYMGCSDGTRTSCEAYTQKKYAQWRCAYIIADGLCNEMLDCNTPLTLERPDGQLQAELTKFATPDGTLTTNKEFARIRDKLQKHIYQGLADGKYPYKAIYEDYMEADYPDYEVLPIADGNINFPIENQ